MAKKKYITRTQALYGAKKVSALDTVKERHKDFGDEFDNEKLRRASSCWNSFDSVRREGERCNRFVYGDQWGDMCKVGNRWMTERDWIIKKQKVPLTINLLRGKVTTVKGLYLKQKVEPTCTAYDATRDKDAMILTKAARSNWSNSINAASAKFSVAAENYLVRGCACAGVYWEYSSKTRRYDASIKVYDPRRVFVDASMLDPTFSDARMIGIIHDVAPAEFLSKFNLSKKAAKLITEEYGNFYITHTSDMLNEDDADKKNQLEYLDFYANNDATRWRFFEIWTKETKRRWRCVDTSIGEIIIADSLTAPLEDYDGLSIMEENERRRQEAIQFGIPENEVPYIDYGQIEDSPFEAAREFYDDYWFVSYLTPTGRIIDEYESPYQCGCPIAVSFYPLVGGEVHSYASDIIDIQKYLNRMTVLNDASIRNMAKGSLLIDKRSIPGDSSQEEIKEQWGDPDGIVTYDSKKGGQLPKQASNTSTSAEISNTIARTFKALDDVSGVFGALQGKDAMSGQAASLYAQQSENASTALYPVINAFNEFLRQVAVYTIKIIDQFYEDGRLIGLSKDEKGVNVFNRSSVYGLEYDVFITMGGSTELAKAKAQEMLVQLYSSPKSLIDDEIFFELSDIDFKDKALSLIREKQQQVQQQQAEQQAMMQQQAAMQQQPQMQQQ